ncbi:MAG: pyridoxal phosphate-dependent aminotransferase, partial [Planctomycetota bacterium]
DEVEAAFASGIRTAFLTDLHNPTGTRLPPETIEAMRASAGRHGARVLMDEVYTEFLPDAPVTAYRADHPAVVVTSSLTKVYGLGALRAGWILVPPDLRERAARFIDYLTVLPPSATAAAAEEVLTNLDRHRERSLTLSRDTLRRAADWTAARGDVDCVPPAAGLISFPRFEGIDDTSALCDWLRDERDTLVVPGRFFGDASRIRMAPMGDERDAAEALRRLGEGVERFRSSGG